LLELTYMLNSLGCLVSGVDCVGTALGIETWLHFMGTTEIFRRPSSVSNGTQTHGLRNGLKFPDI